MPVLHSPACCKPPLARGSASSHKWKAYAEVSRNHFPRKRKHIQGIFVWELIFQIQVSFSYSELLPAAANSRIYMLKYFKTLLSHSQVTHSDTYFLVNFFFEKWERKQICCCYCKWWSTRLRRAHRWRWATSNCWLQALFCLCVHDRVFGKRSRWASGSSCDKETLHENCFYSCSQGIYPKQKAIGADKLQHYRLNQDRKSNWRRKINKGIF